jgi:hypothetical protein
MSALNNLAPEESLIVGERIIKPHKRREPLLLVAVSNQYQKNEMVAAIQIQKSSDFYMAFLPKGDYELLIFADLNNSGDFESDEVVGRASILVNPEQAISGAVLERPPITLDLDHPGRVAFHVRETVQPSTVNQPENSDGSVSIRSQLESFAQTSATRVIGFNETHMGILGSEAARALFLKTLVAVM